ncbi:MAG: molybdopterin molybdotransferase MoeA [Oligoflexia bacterium]|nr:molybdopterin molybdotransferase MoeA [Oligoflexia bacterium]
MISYVDAINILNEVAEQLPKNETEVLLTKSLGSVLSRDVFGREDIPHFNNSAMDGFAVNAEATVNATKDNPIRFYVESSIAAGDSPSMQEIKNPLLAVEIMTGAAMPKGCLNAVVRVEDTEIVEVNGKKEARLFKPVRLLENVRVQASDFRANDLIAEKGTVVDSEYLMALASQGISSLWVRKRLKVAVISTGKELRAVEQERTIPTQIWNSSGPYLVSTLNELGCDVVDLGIIQDDPAIFSRLVKKGLQEGIDVFLSTGAVSMGKHDFVVESLERLGANVRFHKTSIRPGKPICFAEFSKEKAVFFGLPGNPVSTAVGMKFFVSPFLRTRLGVGNDNGFSAKLKNDICKPESLRCFYKGVVELSKEGIVAEILKRQESYVLSSLIRANCWIELPENKAELSKDSTVRIFPLINSFKKGIFL